MVSGYVPADGGSTGYELERPETRDGIGLSASEKEGRYNNPDVAGIVKQDEV